MIVLCHKFILYSEFLLMSARNLEPQHIPVSGSHGLSGTTLGQRIPAPKFGPATPIKMFTRLVSGRPSCSSVSTQIPPKTA